MHACAACGHTISPPSRSPADGAPRPVLEALQLSAERARLAAAAWSDWLRLRPRGCPPGLAAVTCFFNPCGFRAPLRNVQIFRESFSASNVPLLIVELAIGTQHHSLGRGYGEVLRLRARDVLWHKERLLNIGISRLVDRGFGKVAWLDADVRFDDPARWAWGVWHELERSAVCQAFSVAGGDGRPPRIGAVAHHARTARAKPEAVPPSLRHPLGVLRGHTGFAWAATADVLRNVGLYDRAIIGGGDGIMRFASLPRTALWEDDLRRKFTSVHRCDGCGHLGESAALTRDGLEWARRWSDAVAGRVGYVDHRVVDLEHGDHRDRGWTTRREILFRHGFDPALDIGPDDDGCWRWTSEKPELHREVAEYFASRREDGQPP